MKRKKLGVVAFACAAATILAGGVLSNSPFVNPIETKAAAAPVYTLDTTGSLKGSNNSFAGNCDITSGGVTWNVTGNTQMNPWRVGGKNLSAIDREVYTKTAFAKSVSEVKLTVGTADSITVNSLKLIVASTADFNTIISTVPATFAASSTISFVPETGSWSNAFYKFVFNVSVSSGSSNKFVQFSKVEFYEDAATGVLTSLSYSGSPALQKTGEAFNAEGLVFSANYDDGDARNVTSEVIFNPATISSDTTVVKATYETVSCDIPVKVKGDLTSIDCEGTPATQFIGKAFNPTGLTFTAHYGALNEEIAHEEMAFSPEVITADTKVVTASFGGKTVDITGFTVEEISSYRFSEADNDAFSGWSSTYAQHTLEFGGKIKANFASASKQSTSISDCPVSKNTTVTFSATDARFTSLKVSFKQWTTKTQTIQIFVDGAQVGSSHAFPSAGTSVSWTAEEGQSAESIVIKTTASNQIGWESFEFKLVETPKESYAAKFLADTASDCAAGNVTAETWAALETAFNALSEEEKATYKTAVADDTEMGQAIARYDFIIGKYAALNDFMGRGTGTSGLSNLRMSNNNQTSMIALISAFSLGLVAAGAYFISKKRKSVR